MDTKSRSYSHLRFIKIIAFLLAVVTFTSIVLLIVKTINETDDRMLESIFKEDYFKSMSYQEKYNNTVHTLNKLINDYKSEENIRAGNTINKRDLEREKEELFSDFLNNENQDLIIDTESDKLNKLREEYDSTHQEEVNELREDMIKRDLLDFKMLKDNLKREKGLLYYAKSGDTLFSNTVNNSVDDFKKQPSYLILSGNEVEVYPIDRGFKSQWGEDAGEIDRKINVALTGPYLNDMLSKWEKTREHLQNIMYVILGLSLILIGSLIYLFIVTGRRFLGDKEVELSKIDKIYTDISLGVILLTILSWFTVLMNLQYNSIYYIWINLIGSALTSVLACSLVLALLLSLVRHLKNKTILRNSLIFILLSKLYELIKDIYDSGSIAVRVAIAVIVYPLIVAVTFFMFPVTIAIAVWLVQRKVKEYEEIKKGVEKIKNGEINHKIEIERNGELKELSEDINSIGDGFNAAIGNELKSERLKSELITNVSHDLRTPLTSIITYVGLLKNEVNQDKRVQYLEVIEQKSQRLKTLTDDLFEASKATSGNIPVNFEKIDLVSLITQGLGELDGKIRESKLEFIINTKEKIFVKADGTLLWRAIENLLTNIFKYSLRDSRVYIDLVDLGDSVKLSIKNISAYGLNISSDELMERFTRGDESRTSEGSGLGLSISKSLIEAQNGKFDISIDGDLFKAIIILMKFS